MDSREWKRPQKRTNLAGLPSNYKNYFHVDAQLISSFSSSGVATLGRKAPNQYHSYQPRHDSLADWTIRRSGASGTTIASESSARKDLGFLCSVRSSPAKQGLGGTSDAHPRWMGGMETASWAMSASLSW